MKKALMTALLKATKTIYKEEEKRVKDSYHGYRRRSSFYEGYVPVAGRTLKAISFEVIPKAYAEATDNGRLPVSAHTLFYQVRALVHNHDSWRGKTLKPAYFEQTLLPLYRREVDPLPLIYYEPRGILYEPHSGVTLPLGTLDVKNYKFPSWEYNKILYVEKQGLFPVLKASKLGERCDMAIIAGEGFSTEACRMLYKQAEGEYQLFVLHDCDPHGYDISRTLREETERMPNYSVDVIDLGLWMQDAVDMNLETEPFSHKNAISEKLFYQLGDLEKEKWNLESEYDSPSGDRIELNALTSRQLIDYIEEQLEKNGALGKVIPSPDEELQKLVKEFYQDKIETEVEDLIVNEIKLEEIQKKVTEEFEKKIKFEDAKKWIKAAFKKDDSQSWRTASKNKLDKRLDELAEDIEERTLDELKNRIKEIL